MTRLDVYDADTPPQAEYWLGLDETERIELVAAYHRHHRVRLPNIQAHAMMHVIVENQLALGETVVVQTLARLQEEGLGRHDALHAIASVLAEHMSRLLQHARPQPGPELTRQYFEALGQLTAESWRNSG